jgi:hypothetical protein
VILSGDVPEDLAADRVKLVAPEEPHHPFGLLKGLDGRVELPTADCLLTPDSWPAGISRAEPFWLDSR